MYFLSFEHIFKTIVYKTFDFLSIESLFDHRPVVRRIGTYPFQGEAIVAPLLFLNSPREGMFFKSRFFLKMPFPVRIFSFSLCTLFFT